IRDRDHLVVEVDDRTVRHADRLDCEYPCRHHNNQGKRQAPGKADCSSKRTTESPVRRGCHAFGHQITLHVRFGECPPSPFKCQAPLLRAFVTLLCEMTVGFGAAELEYATVVDPGAG